MQIQSKDSVEIVTENYREYSKYVIATRAYPSIIDGCKAVHKRCIHCSYKYLPRHLIKSAEASGKITVLHPHPQSIYSVLVSLASKYDCKFPLYDTKGNFGGHGFPPAAERYTELMLSELAIKIFEPFADYVDMVAGEMNTDEPYALATLLPLCFLHGAYGISTGLSNVNIPALNSVDLIKYYLKILESKDLTTEPDMVIKPNNNGANLVMSKSEWKALLKTGKGTAKFTPVIRADGRKLIITNVPDGKDFENLSKALADEINDDKIDIRDETAEKVKFVVELVPRKRVNIKEIEEKIIKSLSSNESYNFIFADDGIAVFCGLHEVVKRNLEYIIKCVKRKFDTELKNLKYKLTILEIIQKLKTNQKHLNSFVKMSYDDAVNFLMTEYKADREQAKSVLSKPISYLTKEHDIEIKDLKNEIATVKNNNKDIFSYLTTVYQDLLKDVRAFTRYQDITNFVT